MSRRQETREVSITDTQLSCSLCGEMKREPEGRRGDKEEEEEWMSGVRKGEDERERHGDAKKKKKSDQFSHRQFMFPSL